MDVSCYLNRINYDGPTDVSLDTLRGLHYAHLLNVPFENMDIQRGTPIVLEQAALYKKIVERRRGGFCYELNGLFAQLLSELGFEVSMLSAGVALPDGAFGPDFDHMALLVRLDRPWLADVGFGNCFLFPVLLDDSSQTTDSTGVYCVKSDDSVRTLVKASDEGAWLPLYRFTLDHHELPEYEPRSIYHQTSPDSHFVRRAVCTRATIEGRITLSDKKLIVDEGGTRRETILPDDKACRGALLQHFDLAL